jgi:hypothetical protein
MTRFLVEARPDQDRPGWLEHTFYVETVVCDESATLAAQLAAKWPPGSGTYSVLDGALWVYLARVSCQHGHLPDVKEWQDGWLRQWVGMTKEDQVKNSIRFDKAPPAKDTNPGT